MVYVENIGDIINVIVLEIGGNIGVILFILCLVC